MDINDIKSTLEKLDPLKINDSAEINETYDKMKEELTRAGFLDVPTNVPESTVVHREGGLPTGAKLTPEEVAQMLKPNASIDEPISPDAATVKTTSTKRAAEIYDSFAPMVSPHFTTGMSHAQTMALANVVKEKLTEEKEASSDSRAAYPDSPAFPRLRQDSSPAPCPHLGKPEMRDLRGRKGSSPAWELGICPLGRNRVHGNGILSGKCRRSPLSEAARWNFHRSGRGGRYRHPG